MTMPADHTQPAMPADGCGDLLDCPWCKDTEFDEVGLKLHIINGHCDVFNELSVSLPETRQANVLLSDREGGASHAS